MEEATNGENAEIPFYVENFREPCANESIIDFEGSLEIKEGFPPENKFLLFPVSPKLEQSLRELGDSAIVKQLDYVWPGHLNMLPRTYMEKEEQIIGKWNYVMVNYPRLFSLKTRFLWFKSLLGPERSTGRGLTSKQYTIKRENLLNGE
jgi:hypothetical protein